MTWLAADTTRSAESNAAVGVPANHGSAEEMAAIHPDLVLADAFSDPNTVVMIRRLGIPVAVLPAPAGYAGIIARVREVADLLGNPDRGRAIISEIERTIESRAAPSAGTPLVAELEPGFYTEGEGTLIDEAIMRAGGAGLGRRLGLHGYATLALERLVAAPVDLLILPADADRFPSLSNRRLGHPALRQRLGRIRHLAIPGLLTDCPSPASAALVPMIGRALQAREPARQGGDR